MRRGLKVLTISLWTLMGLALVGVVGMKLTKSQRGPAPLYAAAEFSLTDQNARPFSSKDLKGKPYVASFVFTRCAGPCPIMTGSVAKLQGQLPKSVEFVTISVDPEYDQPDVLKAYAKEFNADESRWHFLTGPRAAVYDVAAQMKLAVLPAQGQQPIIHSEKLILVDAVGQVRGHYNGVKSEEVARLVEDATKVNKEAGL